MPAFTLIKPGSPEPHVCLLCYGDKSFDVAVLEGIGQLCYLQNVEKQDKTATPALAILSFMGQGHEGIIAAFSRKPLPAPICPWDNPNYKDDQPELETAYEE